MDKSLFKRATEDTPDPTPGYMFRDIAQWTFVDQNTQAKLVSAIFDKLNPKSSVHVLAKVLRIIKVVCETGHADFQKEMQRRNDQIKDYASYRGVQHPQFGDRLNEKVRIAAKEAIDAAFTARKDTKIQLEAGHGNNAAEEKSSSGVVGAVTSMFISAPKTGGDNRIATMPTTNKWADHMAKAGQEESAPKQLVTNVVEKAKLGFGLFGNENIKSKEDRIFESQADVGEFRAVDVAIVGGSRGPFGRNADSGFAQPATAPAVGASSSGWKFAEEAEAGLPPVEQHTTLPGRILTPYQREVERVGQMKNAPQRGDITQFLATAKEIHDESGGAMSYEDLAQTLDEAIAQRHPWQQRLNCMTVIEALLKAELSPEIADYFNENPEDVQRNVHVVQSSLKEKSQKVLKILGIPERAAAKTSTAHAPSNIGASSEIDFGSMTVTRKSRGNKKATTTEIDLADAPQQPFVPELEARAAPSGAAQDPNRLRRRAQLTEAEARIDNSNTNAVSTSTCNGWGGGNTASGWGSNNGAAASAWGAPASSDAGDWGNPSSGWGAPPTTVATPTQVPPPPPPVASAPATTKAAIDFDELFGTKPSSSSSAEIAPSSAVQSHAVPRNVPAGPTAAQIAAKKQMEMVLQMQQQVQTMLSQINMSDPSALPQMQMLMQQQQQLMTMMQQAQQAQREADAAAGNSSLFAGSASNVPTTSSPLQPHGSFNAPSLSREATKEKEKAFTDVQNEMVRMLMDHK